MLVALLLHLLLIVLSQVRSLILRDSLETCIVAGAEHKHSNEVTQQYLVLSLLNAALANFTTQMPVVAPQRIAQKVKSALLGKKKQAAEYYQKGSHSFIATLHFFLALVKVLLMSSLCSSSRAVAAT